MPRLIADGSRTPPRVCDLRLRPSAPVGGSETQNSMMWGSQACLGWAVCMASCKSSLTTLNPDLYCFSGLQTFVQRMLGVRRRLTGPAHYGVKDGVLD